MGQILAHNAVSLAFVAAAAGIAMSGNNGWGWCIFGAVVTFVVVGVRCDDDESA